MMNLSRGQAILKICLINPKEPGKLRKVFPSRGMSYGIIVKHEVKKMPKIAVMTDSSADINTQQAEQMKLTVMRFPLMIDGQ